MRHRWLVVAAFLVCLAYLASPYLTLYRLDRALRTGDADYINAHVDWPALREGVVSQIDAAITGQSAPPPDNELPAFGSGFAHHMAAQIVDKAMEREAMMARIRQYAFRATPGAVADPASVPSAPDRVLRWACFDGPLSFDAELQIGGAEAQPVTLELRLLGGTWEVVRASMPPSLLMQAAART